MDILDDMGVSKLSAKSLFKSELVFKSNQTVINEHRYEAPNSFHVK